MITRRAAFLDRDGVLNRDEKGYTHRLDDLEIIPGVISGLKLLQNSGFQLFVITNQSGIARGKYRMGQVRDFHAAMERIFLSYGITIELFLVCPHHPEGNLNEYSYVCECRKPGTKLVSLALRLFQLQTDRCVFIGDRNSDIKCGKELGMNTVLVSSDPSVQTEATFKCRNLEEAAHIIKDN